MKNSLLVSILLALFIFQVRSDCTTSNSTNSQSSSNPSTTQPKEVLDLRTEILNKKFKQIAYVNGYRQNSQANYESDIGLGSPFDVIILTFWNPSYMAGSMTTINNPQNELGWLYPQVDQNKILDTIKQKFIKQKKLFFISAFGDTFKIGNQIPETVADQLAQWVNQRPQIDGIDLDLEDNSAFQSNTFLPWISKFQRRLLTQLTDKNIIITHAPQAFYFSREHYKNWNTPPYQDLSDDIKNQIAWYNIQFYNQGTLCPYETYENLFITSSPNCPKTSVMEISQSIPMNKIIVGKPAYQTDAANTGFVDPNHLICYFYEFQDEQKKQAAGYFFWALNRSVGVEQGKIMDELAQDILNGR